MLNKEEVEGHTAHEQKYGSLFAIFHRIHLLSKLLWKSPVLNFIQNEQLCRKYRQNFIYVHVQIMADNALIFMKFALAYQLH